MSDKTETPFEKQCSILGDLWMQYRFDPQFSDFVSYNDMGLPMAFMVSEKLVTPTALAKSMIEETFQLLLVSLKIEDDDFESLDDLFLAVPDWE
jgi:hypothetical protein